MDKDRRIMSDTKSPEGPDVEYEYVVNIRAIETFVNLMAREGISIPALSSKVSFRSPRRLDMKRLKEKGIIWSYSMNRVSTTEDVVEEG